MAVYQAEAGVDLVSCGDDIGMQDRMIMSPDLWRKWFKPRWANIWAPVKRANPDCAVFYHSDGYIEPVIPDLLKIGVEVLNPVQPECMDQRKLKERYGDRLALWGCIGTQTTMPFGTLAEVDAAVKQCVRHLGVNGACPSRLLTCSSPRSPGRTSRPSSPRAPSMADTTKAYIYVSFMAPRSPRSRSQRRRLLVSSLHR